MKNNKRIQNEIKKINKKQEKAATGAAACIFGGTVFAGISWVVLFLVGSAFYFADNYFYIKVDNFSDDLMKGIFYVVAAICAFIAFKMYGYTKEKKSLKRVLSRKRRVVR